MAGRSLVLVDSLYKLHVLLYLNEEQWKRFESSFMNNYYYYVGGGGLLVGRETNVFIVRGAMAVVIERTAALRIRAECGGRREERE